MSALDELREMKNERRRQRRKAVKKLEELKNNKINLARPVFFVPGWRDESNECWKFPYHEGYVPIKEWLPNISQNPGQATYITFNDKEARKCDSFLDFAPILKEKIWTKIGRNEKFDIVCHSMGGLDTVAAITAPEDPLLNVNNFITVATPHQGSQLGEIAPKIIKYKAQHAAQSKNLDPDREAIKLINELETRKKLLRRVKKLYCLMGTRDMAVMRSARYNKKGLDPELYKKKVKIVEFGGARHSQGQGITQDPRAILAVINILSGIELEKPKYNYGYVFKK